MFQGPRPLAKVPLYSTVHSILTNPVYACAYAFGRTTSKVIVENGRKRVRRGLRRARTDWELCTLARASPPQGGREIV